MKEIKLWPHLTIIALICAGLGAGAALLWNRHEPATQAAILPSAARIERVDGEVGLQRSLAEADSDAQWLEVTPNTPISVGDRIYAREDSRTGIAFTGRNFARLEPNSSLDVLTLSDRRTQLALRDGSAIFNVGELEPDGLFEVATPVGAFDLRQPGLYEVGLNDDGSAWISVLSGLAQVVGLAGTGQVSKGEMLTLVGQTAADIIMSRLSPDYAGGLLDDYYGYQYPGLYDGRYRDYNAYLSDPYYYDPYNRYVSYRYADDSIPGVWALDSYGDWVEVSSYGYAWRPRVETGWAPYRQGYWMMDDPYGLTWVSTEPWGYAPYHYGRWANLGGEWYWIPDRVNTRPVYSPALVAFIPPTESNVIGWVPLAPGDPYVATYYDADWRPHYLTRTPVALEQRVINLDVPGAVTIVSAEDFGRVIDAKALKKFDRERFAKARPVLDPLSVGELRQLALSTTNERRRVDIPPGIAKKLETTQVFTSAKPFAPPFREGRKRESARVEPVPEKQKKQKLQFKDEREAGPPVRAAGPAPDRKDERQARALEREAARGGKEARREAQELRRQERAEPRAVRRQGPTQAASERAVRPSEQRAQGERVGLSRKAEREAARGRAPAAAEKPQRVRQQSPKRAAPQMMRQQRQGPPQQKGGRAQAAAPQPAKHGAQKSAGKGKGRH